MKLEKNLWAQNEIRIRADLQQRLEIKLIKFSQAEISSRFDNFRRL